MKYRVLQRLLLLAAAGVLGGFTAGPVQSVQVPAVAVPGARVSPNPLPATLYLPAGGGRFPVVILLHGCSGIGRGGEMRVWAGRVMEWGYAALVPDSFTPRGVTNVCAPQNQPLVTGADRAGDVIDAALFLRTLPAIDPERIGAIGFSHGGGTAAMVTRKDFQDFRPGLLKASVDYYGPCREPNRHGTVPLLVLAGEDDDWGNPAKTCTAFGARLRSDQPFEVVTYPHTVHAFDNPALVMVRYNVGHALGYNAQSANDSFVRVHAFLDKWMGH